MPLLKRTLRFALLGALFVSIPALAQDAAAWIERMNQALTTLDYQGDLVYQHGNQLETLRLFRASGPDGGRERLLTLSGAPREVIRSGGRVTCIGTSAQPASYGDGSLTPRLMDRFARPAALRNQYAVTLGSIERIAEREAQLLEFRPRDAFRYGFRLWLDSETGMLLKVLRFGSDGRPVEQLMFTRIALGERPSDVDLAGTATLPVVSTALDLPQALATAAQTNWTVVDPPQGFELVLQQPAAQRSSEHVVYSDGIANVSVYVEPLRNDVPAFSGPASRGALNLYGRVLDGRQITVLGDVPTAAVERFARGVSFAGG